MSGDDESDDDYRLRDSAGDRCCPRSWLAAVAVLLALGVAAVAVGRPVVAGWQEDERRAGFDQQHRPVGWMPAGDRASHSRSVISRAEFRPRSAARLRN